jgi:hypothetical protein
MKIEYEIGDRVFAVNRDESVKIVGLRKKGYVIENKFGERFFVGNRQIEPYSSTIEKAKHVRSEIA